MTDDDERKRWLELQQMLVLIYRKLDSIETILWMGFVALTIATCARR